MVIRAIKVINDGSSPRFGAMPETGMLTAIKLMKIIENSLI